MFDPAFLLSVQTFDHMNSSLNIILLIAFVFNTEKGRQKTASAISCLPQGFYKVFIISINYFFAAEASKRASMERGEA